MNSELFLPDMADSCHCQFLKVASGYKGTPMSQHSILINNRVKEFCISPLIYNFILQISNIDCLKENWSDPWLKKKPTSKVNPSDYSISTSYITLNEKFLVMISYRFVFLWRNLILLENLKLLYLSDSL